MILCVCPNPSVDVFQWLDNLQTGQVNRVREEEFYPGGKGVHVALAASELGEDIVLLGFWGGPTGKWIQIQCKKQGIRCEGPEVEGLTRTCTTFKSTRQSFDDTELLGAGPILDEPQISQFYDTFEALIPKASCITLSGSWPRNSDVHGYARLIQRARKHQKPVYLDCNGEQLENALPKQPTGLHLNISEARQTYGDHSIEKIVHLMRHQADLSALTAGEEGLYLASGNEYIHASYKVEKVHSAVGSGDCLVAGLAVARIRGYNFGETARLAVACGAANCLRKELGMLHKEDVDRIMPEVSIQTMQFQT